MSLSRYGKTNYEVKVPISFEYAREVAVSADVTQPNLATQYRYTRHVTKTYMFKGMDEKTVKACLDAKRRQYMRRFMQWRQYACYFRCPYEFSQSPYGYMELPPYTSQVAKFTVSRNGDAPVFNLQIAIDETTAVYSTRDYDPTTSAGVASIETLFTKRTSDVDNYPIITGYAENPVNYYHSYTYEYAYDENLTTDVEVSE